MSVLAIVPARGGSRGLPGKNLLEVGGQSLVARAVRAGLDSGAIDVVVVSSDDDDILAEGARAGAVAERRPDELATDQASTMDVVRHHLAAFPDADVVVVLQPTSPLRTAEDVRACVRAVDDAPAAVTVVPGSHPWEWSMRLGLAKRLEPVAGWRPFSQRRQDLGQAFSINGAVYAARRHWLEQSGSFVAEETVAVVMPVDRSVDIDTPEDLDSARMLWSRSQSGDAEAPDFMSDEADAPRAWVLLGGGGHARSVADAIRRRGQSVRAVVDPARSGSWQCPVVDDDASGLDLARDSGIAVVPAVGSNELRIRLVERARAYHVSLAPFVASSATVSRTAVLGEGTVVLEHAHVGAGSTVGSAVVVNTAAVVEHDVRIGDGTHVAPGSVVLGGCTIGRSCLIGAKSTVLPLVHIGDGAVVGAGAVVVADVEEGATVVGVHRKSAGLDIRTKTFRLDDFEVGASDSLLIIAEAGVNHDGDPGVAHALIDAAVDVGADIVKFQTFDPAALVSAAAPTAPYQGEGRGTQADLLSALVLPESVWAELQQHAAERGIGFLSTPFDIDSARMLVGSGVPALKVGSGELTNLPLLRALADLGVPMILSTGMANLAEVADAVAASAAAPGLGLLHCVSAYPAPTAQANLRVLPVLAAEFGLPVGWSDHTIGPQTAVAAVALGATILEKHLTLDPSRSGPDHAASAAPEAFAEYVALARSAHAALGDGVKRRMPAEVENAPVVRRSWHALHRLEVGTVITDEEVIALRPEKGVPVNVSVAGRSLLQAVDAGSPITADSLTPRPDEGSL